MVILLLPTMGATRIAQLLIKMLELQHKTKVMSWYVPLQKVAVGLMGQE
jgi:hypothetical protein